MDFLNWLVVDKLSATKLSAAKKKIRLLVDPKNFTKSRKNEEKTYA